MNSHADESVALFIDGANLSASACALGFEIDYARLPDLFAAGGRLVRAYFYTALLEIDDHAPLRPLVDWLDYNGYTVVTKPAKTFTDAMGNRRVKGDMECANWCECSRCKTGRMEKASHHFHPESWAVIREDGGQALTGARAGGANEHRKVDRPGRRGFHPNRRQHPSRRYGEEGRSPAVSENPCTYVRTAPGPGRSPCHPAVVAGSLRKGVSRNR